MKIKSLTAPFRHPATQKARVIVRRIVIVCAVILAVAVVTSVAVDVGPALKGLAEREGSRYLGRPLTIGRMEVRLWDGSYVFEDLRIDSLPPTSTPFLVAKRITVVNSWRTLFNRRFVLEQIEMTDWRMHVETKGDQTNFPNFRRGPRGQSRWTTTLAYVHAHRGEFTYQDFGSNWGVVTRNIDVVVEKPTPDAKYRGTAKFTDGLTAIQLRAVPHRYGLELSDRRWTSDIRPDVTDYRGHAFRAHWRCELHVLARADALDEVGHRFPQGQGVVLRRRYVFAERQRQV